MTISQIRNICDTNELSVLIENYLDEIGERDKSHGESYAETAGRLGGDAILDAAETRWFELGS